MSNTIDCNTIIEEDTKYCVKAGKCDYCSSPATTLVHRNYTSTYHAPIRILCNMDIDELDKLKQSYRLLTVQEAFLVRVLLINQ